MAYDTPYFPLVNGNHLAKVNIIKEEKYQEVPSNIKQRVGKCNFLAHLSVAV